MSGLPEPKPTKRKPRPVNEPATPVERKLYEATEGRYYTDLHFQAMVNEAADIAMRMDPMPGVSLLSCRIYYRTAAAVAILLKEKTP